MISLIILKDNIIFPYVHLWFVHPHSLLCAHTCIRTCVWCRKSSITSHLVGWNRISQLISKLVDMTRLPAGFGDSICLCNDGAKDGLPSLHGSCLGSGNPNSNPYACMVSAVTMYPSSLRSNRYIMKQQHMSLLFEVLINFIWKGSCSSLPDVPKKQLEDKL